MQYASHSKASQKLQYINNFVSKNTNFVWFVSAFDALIGLCKIGLFYFHSKVWKSENKRHISADFSLICPQKANFSQVGLTRRSSVSNWLQKW